MFQGKIGSVSLFPTMFPSFAYHFPIIPRPMLPTRRRELSLGHLAPNPWDSPQGEAQGDHYYPEIYTIYYYTNSIECHTCFGLGDNHNYRITSSYHLFRCASVFLRSCFQVRQFLKATFQAEDNTNRYREYVQPAVPIHVDDWCRLMPHISPK